MDKIRIWFCIKIFSETNLQHLDLASEVPRKKIPTNWDDVFENNVVPRLQLDSDE